jgi:hypothetical protein
MQEQGEKHRRVSASPAHADTQVASPPDIYWTIGLDVEMEVLPFSSRPRTQTTATGVGCTLKSESNRHKAEIFTAIVTTSAKVPKRMVRGACHKKQHQLRQST